MTEITQGPITNRRVLKIALPIVLSNITVPLLGLVDTGVVGQLGEAAPIGAVGVGAAILSALFWTFGFLRMGTTGLVAQARGAGDLAEASALLLRGLLIAAAAGLFFVFAQGLLFGAALTLAPASEDVERLTRAYLQVRVWGSPATIGLFAITGWLIAMENSRGVLILQVVMNALNILLDLWFVLGLGWGVEGVALATLLAEWSGLVLGLWLCRAALGVQAARRLSLLFDRARLLRMAQVNGDIMVRSVLLTLSFTAFQFLGARFGDDTLAANQVLFQFVHIIAFALDGFAFSTETLVGSAVGKGDRHGLRRALRLCSQWGLVAVAVLMVVFSAGGGLLIDVMVKSPEVQQVTRAYLWWVILMPLVTLPSFMLDGAYIGATWTREMRNAMIQSVALYAGVLVVLLPFFGNHGLWAAIWCLMIARGVTLWRPYSRLLLTV